MKRKEKDENQCKTSHHIKWMSHVQESYLVILSNFIIANNRKKKKKKGREKECAK